MWIYRRISERLRSLVATRPVIVVTGARQVGKSSLLELLFPKHHCVSLDLPSQAEYAENESAAFLEAHPSPLLIDEIQYAPNIFRYLKIDVDKNRNDYGRFILTGSQKFLLMKGVSDSLAGRATLVDLEGLAYSELLASREDVTVDHFMLRGGYPELWTNDAIDSREYYNSYLRTYLERDVRQLLNVGNLRDFERFVRVCATRSGQLLNKSDLARDVGVSSSTANTWLSVLEASNQLTLLEPWFSNKSKSLTKTPKLYWNDAGFLCWLLGIFSIDELQKSLYTGAVWETFVFSEMRKQLAWSGENLTPYYFRDRSVEVDFLLNRGGWFDLFEAKYSKEPNESAALQLNDVAEKLGNDKVKSKTIICRTHDAYALKNGVRVQNIKALKLSTGVENSL